MKYTFESSEKEVTALFSFLGAVVKEVGKTVRHSTKIRSKTARTLTPDRQHVISTVAKDDDAKDSDDVKVLPFLRDISSPVRKTEKRNEAEIVPETEPAPAPRTTKEEKTIALGRLKFDAFIANWLVGIDLETLLPLSEVVQPNRELLLRELCNSPYSFPVLIFVRSCGGLQRAIYEVTQSKHLARRLPDYLVPPASIVFSDLADTYEYSNPWKEEE